MEYNWKIPTGILCVYGFFKEMKPSEPFLTPYLNSTFKNFTREELNSEVYPIWTYSYLVTLFFVFLLTDFLRYKPLIILESLSYLATRILLIWGKDVLAMQFMQIAYGMATGTEIAYYSYVYAMVTADHYQKVTGYTRAIVLLGRASAGILGQILISFHVTNYLVLNYISLGSISISVVIACLLPKVDGSIFRPNENEEGPEGAHEAQVTGFNKCQLFVRGLKNLAQSFKGSYSNTVLLRWSIWWGLAMCGYLQVGNYIQSLWKEIVGTEKNDKNLNGAVEAVGTLAGSLVAFLLSIIQAKWGVITDVLVGVISLIDFALLLILARTESIWIAYITYVGYRMTFTLLITIATFQVACYVKLSGYGLIFGWNTFFALCLQSILTLIVADERGLDLDIRTQFVVYSGYYGFIAVIFLIKPTLVLLMKCRVICFRKRNYKRFDEMSTNQPTSGVDSNNLLNPPSKTVQHDEPTSSRVI